MGCSPFVRASAEFDGTYVATDPYFRFQYGFTEAGADLSIDVWNNTTYSSIFNQSFNSASTDTLLLPTPVGDEIRVRFKLSAFNDNASGNLDYAMSAVAPEPVSSILFLTGGGVLMGSRFRKKATKVQA